MRGAIRRGWGARGPKGGLAQGALANCVGGGWAVQGLRANSNFSGTFPKTFLFSQFPFPKKISSENFPKTFCML